MKSSDVNVCQSLGINETFIAASLMALYTVVPVMSLLTQSCPTLCDPMNCSPPGSSVHGNFQARALEKVAISY